MCIYIIHIVTLVERRNVPPVGSSEVPVPAVPVSGTSGAPVLTVSPGVVKGGNGLGVEGAYPVELGPSLGYPELGYPPPPSPGVGKPGVGRSDG